jgi:hypothetical protein
MLRRIREAWSSFSKRHPGTAQFLVFFLVSNGVTVLQLVLMPVMRRLFALTSLVGTDFQVWQIGSNVDGSAYFIFDYAAGALPGGGGGLAYFLAVEVTLLVAQVINFFAQRSITFHSNSSVAQAAAWYALAYVVITLTAAALQGVYKAPLYDFLMARWGAVGETTADVLTMIINSAISFWVFFPIFRVIFKRTPEPVGATVSTSETTD